MKKVNIYILIGIGIIIIGGWMILSNINQPISTKETNQSLQENIKNEIVLLIVNDGEETPKIYETKFNEGVTAFALLKNAVEKLNIALKTKNYDFGILVEAIGNKENGQGGKYWLYYVNGQMPMVSADKNVLKPGDKVEFKFEKSSF